MKILVTGGAGFIGSHIVDRIIKNGDKVVIIDNLSTGKNENINPHAKFYKIDITDKENLEEVFAKEKPDIANHHAAQTDVRKSMEEALFDAKVNILGSLNIINLSLKYSIKKIIYASTSAVYPEPEYFPVDEKHLVKPLSAYGITKYTTELYLGLYYQSYGLRYTILRYGNVYGPRQDPDSECGVVAIFSQQMLKKIIPTIFGDGSKTRDYIYIDDIVNANMIVLEGLGDGEAFNLGCRKEISDFQVFESIRGALGVVIKPHYSKKRPGELDRISLNSAKAKELLGWTPKIKFEEGISMAVEYYKSRI